MATAVDIDHICEQTKIAYALMLALFLMVEAVWIAKALVNRLAKKEEMDAREENGVLPSGKLRSG